MSIQEDKFKEIANAIRTQKGTKNKIKANDFAKEILSIPKGSGNATPSDVLSGKTFSNDSGEQIGTILTYQGSNIINPSRGGETLKTQGTYLDKNLNIMGDTDLKSENIKKGINIFGVDGSVIQASGNAKANQVLKGVTASNASGAITGTIPLKNAQTYTPTTKNQVINSGQYINQNQTILGDPELVSGNIKKGVNIFGVNGTLEEKIPIPTKNITNIVCENPLTGNSLKISWQDPEDSEYIQNGQIYKLNEWRQTIVVMRTDRYPNNINDGTLVVRTMTRNQYKETPYEIRNLSNNVTYYLSLFPVATNGLINNDTSQRASEKVSTLDKVFGNNSWETIVDAIKKDSVPSTWNVGDSKKTLLNNGKYINFVIIAKNFENGKLVLANETPFEEPSALDSRPDTNKWGIVDTAFWHGNSVAVNSNTIRGWLPDIIRSNIKTRTYNYVRDANNGSLQRTSSDIWLLSISEMYQSVPSGNFTNDGTWFSYYTKEKRASFSNEVWTRTPQKSRDYKRWSLATTYDGVAQHSPQESWHKFVIGFML